MTFGELIMLTWLTCTILVCALYMWEHARINNLVGKVSRSFGGAAVGISAVIIFPATRHSVLLPLFGIPFERALKFHRILGICFFLSATVHMFAMYWSYVDIFLRGSPHINATTGERYYTNMMNAGDAWKAAADRMVTWETGFPHGPPLAGFLAWCVMLLMIVTTHFRRSKWELFLVIHMGYVIVFLMVFIHYPTTIILCLPAVAAHSVDLILRSKSLGKIEEATFYEDAEVTRLVIHPPQGFAPPTAGSWVVIGIPSLVEDCQGSSRPRLEMHPFSVSSTRHDGTFTLHIKDMGHGTWTAALGAAAERLKDADIAIEGPFGRLNPKLGVYPHVTCIGGGIGVTPLLHMAQLALDDPTRLKGGHLTLIWSFPRGGLIEPFSDTLADLFARIRTAGDASPVSIKMFETRKKNGEHITRSEEHPLLHHKDGLTIGPSQEDEPGKEGELTKPLDIEVARTIPETIAGRPNNKAILLESLEGTSSPPSNESKVVYTCGPPAMCKEVMTICHENNIMCHEETFEF